MRCGATGAPHLDAGLGDLRGVGQLLPQVDVGVHGVLEDQLQRLQLRRREAGPFPTLRGRRSPLRRLRRRPSGPARRGKRPEGGGSRVGPAAPHPPSGGEGGRLRRGLPEAQRGHGSGRGGGPGSPDALYSRGGGSAGAGVRREAARPRGAGGGRGGPGTPPGSLASHPGLAGGVPARVVLRLGCPPALRSPEASAAAGTQLPHACPAGWVMDGGPRPPGAKHRQQRGEWSRVCIHLLWAKQLGLGRLALRMGPCPTDGLFLIQHLG